jgi:hypothetical protein
MIQKNFKEMKNKKEFNKFLIEILSKWNFIITKGYFSTGFISQTNLLISSHRFLCDTIFRLMLHFKSQ